MIYAREILFFFFIRNPSFYYFFFCKKRHESGVLCFIETLLFSTLQPRFHRVNIASQPLISRYFCGEYSGLYSQDCDVHRIESL